MAVGLEQRGQQSIWWGVGDADSVAQSHVYTGQREKGKWRQSSESPCLSDQWPKIAESLSFHPRSSPAGTRPHPASLE